MGQALRKVEHGRHVLAIAGEIVVVETARVEATCMTAGGNGGAVGVVGTPQRGECRVAL